MQELPGLWFDLGPLLAQALVRDRHLGAQLLGKQRNPVFLQPPAIQLQLRIALAFLGVLVRTGLVLSPQAGQFTTPDPILLHLGA